MSAEDIRLIVFTLAVAALAVTAALPFGPALGWWFARKDWRGKALVETLVMLPLLVPPVVTALVLLKLFGRRGPLGGDAGEDAVAGLRTG